MEGWRAGSAGLASGFGGDGNRNVTPGKRSIVRKASEDESDARHDWTDWRPPSVQESHLRCQSMGEVRTCFIHVTLSNDAGCDKQTMYLMRRLTVPKCALVAAGGWVPIAPCPIRPPGSSGWSFSPSSTIARRSSATSRTRHVSRERFLGDVPADDDRRRGGRTTARTSAMNQVVLGGSLNPQQSR
jgi:hypothetical protein